MVTTTKREKITNIITKASLGVVFLAIIGFIGLKLYPVLHGPKVDLATLTDGQVLHDPLIHISGKSFYTKTLIVNGDTLATAPDGSFNEPLLLHPGYNLITVSAQDRFGAKTSHDYALMLVDDGTSPVLSMTTSPTTPSRN